MKRNEHFLENYERGTILTPIERYWNWQSYREYFEDWYTTIKDDIKFFVDDDGRMIDDEAIAMNILISELDSVMATLKAHEVTLGKLSNEYEERKELAS